MTTHILLVDDDPAILEIFSIYFSTTDDLEVMGTAKTGRQALAWLDANTCDLVLSDIHMPDIDGLELLQNSRQCEHPPLFVAMTAFDTDETMVKCLSLGAVGYIVKGQAPKTIVHSLRDAIQGGTILSHDCLNRLMNIQNSDYNHAEEKLIAPSLSAREHTILSLIHEGKTNREIGKSMHLAEVTIRKAISNLFLRFSAKNRVDLAVKYQLVKDLYRN